MRQQGRLTQWDDARGFGFITPLDGSARVFVHVSEFPRDKRRPEALDLLTFSVTRDNRGRLHATEVGFLTPTRSASVLHRRPSSHVRPRRARRSDLRFPLTVGASFFAVLAGLVVMRVAPVVVLGLYAAASVVLFGLYAADKSAAQGGGWRVPESTLHLLAFAGGWPGALLAQRLFRHKTIKQPFQRIFKASVLANCLLLLVVLVELAAAPG